MKKIEDFFAFMFCFAGIAACLTCFYLGLIWVWSPGERGDIKWLALLCIFPVFAFVIYKRTESSRVKLVLRSLLVIGICIFCGLEACIIAGAKSDSYEAYAGSDYIVVLGNKLSGENVTITLKNRLDKGADLAGRLEKPVIVTGGNTGGGLQEADVMKAYLEQRVKMRIIPEGRALDTKQNFVYTAAITGKQSRIVIVTSEMHMFRAKLLAGWSGYQDVTGVTSQTEKKMLWYFNLREVISLFREILYKVAETVM